jgi:hypothetical protein
MSDIHQIAAKYLHFGASKEGMDSFIKEIFGAQFDDGSDHSDDQAVYSDRLLQWDYNKHNELCEKYFGNKGQLWSNRDPKLIESFLCDYMGKPIKLTKIDKTENRATGYPIWIFFYREISYIKSEGNNVSWSEGSSHFRVRKRSRSGILREWNNLFKSRAIEP